MSYAWERVAEYASALDAEHWCDARGIDRRDRDIRPSSSGVELFVRSTAFDGHENDNRKNGFFELA